MDIWEAMKQRHSVRQYQDRPLEEAAAAALQEEIEHCNQESGLHIQLVRNEPKAFDGFMAHYGKFKGVTNYIAMVGSSSAEEVCGYYGEKLVLLAQQLGLNTCWVAMSYTKIKTAYRVLPGEKLHLVIALGYGENQGKAHVSKPMDKVSEAVEPSPSWFRKGVEAALLAPTAVNQQKFRFLLEDDGVIAKAGVGPYTKIDLGIAKYHFEQGAGPENVIWKK